MSKPKVESYNNSFDEWRIVTNTLSDEIGDLANIYDPLKTDLIQAINDLETRKANLSDAIFVGPVQINDTLTVSTINNLTLTAPATTATLTLADGSSLTTSGAFDTTLTATANTTLTLPANGTLATETTAAALALALG